MSGENGSRKKTNAEKKAQQLATYQFLITDANAPSGLKDIKIYVASGYNAVIIRAFRDGALIGGGAMTFHQLAQTFADGKVSQVEREAYERYKHFVSDEEP